MGQSSKPPSPSLRHAGAGGLGPTFHVSFLLSLRPSRQHRCWFYPGNTPRIWSLPGVSPAVPSPWVQRRRPVLVPVPPASAPSGLQLPWPEPRLQGPCTPLAPREVVKGCLLQAWLMSPSPSDGGGCQGRPGLETPAMWAPRGCVAWLPSSRVCLRGSWSYVSGTRVAVGWVLSPALHSQPSASHSRHRRWLFMKF